MFVITNREVFPDKTGLNAFGTKPNPAGPLELRLAEASKSGNRWRVEILPDQVTPGMAAEAGLDLSGPDPVYTSRYVAAKLLARVNPKLTGARGKGRNFVLFVHGFNNDMKAALERARDFERSYGVEVLVFSWPADGGGAKGVLSYLSDKADAQASIGALGRVMGKLQEFLFATHAEHVKRVEELAEQRHGNDDEAWCRFFTEQSQKWCPFSVSLVLHSMGNYLFKKMLESSVFRDLQPIFDNVILAAADTNNADHKAWVEQIAVRRRVFITLNEHDVALAASRLKMGERQKARLGHWIYDLNAANATYVNFTDAPHVGSSHAYFEGTALKNPQVKAFFHAALNGEAAEQGLTYDAARNFYRVG